MNKGKNISTLLYLLAVVMMFGLSSCFEIIEEVTLDKDGSGSLQYTLNMSQSRVKLTQLMKLDSINGYPIPSQQSIHDTLDYYLGIAKKMEGLSNFKKVENFDDMIFSLSFDFDNLDALNRAVQKMGGVQDANIHQNHYSYQPAEKRYHRSGDYNMKKEFEKLRSVDKAIFNNAKYISIFRTNTEIKDVKNPDAQLSPTKKAVMLMLPILDIINEKKDITNTIIFKP